MDEETRLKARELLLRARIYRFTATLCAIFGMVMFLYLYFKHIRGDVMEALGNPTIVGIVLLPFLPAFIVSWMAVRTENKFLAELEKLKEPEAAAQKKDDK